jgi:hypothetical protein
LSKLIGIVKAQSDLDYGTEGKFESISNQVEENLLESLYVRKYSQWSICAYLPPQIDSFLFKLNLHDLAYLFDCCSEIKT